MATEKVINEQNQFWANTNTRQRAGLKNAFKGLELLSKPVVFEKETGTTLAEIYGSDRCVISATVGPDGKPSVNVFRVNTSMGLLVMAAIGDHDGKNLTINTMDISTTIDAKTGSVVKVKTADDERIIGEAESAEVTAQYNKILKEWGLPVTAEMVEARKNGMSGLARAIVEKAKQNNF